MTAPQPVSLGHKFDPPAIQLLSWDHLKARETGASLDSFLFTKVGLQIEGEFSGATVNIEGSNDGDHWHVLIDIQDNHMKFSFPGMADVGQTARFIRPVIIDGDEMTDVSIFALCRGII